MCCVFKDASENQSKCSVAECGLCRIQLRVCHQLQHHQDYVKQICRNKWSFPSLVCSMIFFSLNMYTWSVYVLFLSKCIFDSSFLYHWVNFAAKLSCHIQHFCSFISSWTCSFIGCKCICSDMLICSESNIFKTEYLKAMINNLHFDCQHSVLVIFLKKRNRFYMF